MSQLTFKQIYKFDEIVKCKWIEKIENSIFIILLCKGISLDNTDILFWVFCRPCFCNIGCLCIVFDARHFAWKMLFYQVSKQTALATAHVYQAVLICEFAVGKDTNNKSNGQIFPHILSKRNLNL